MHLSLNQRFIAYLLLLGVLPLLVLGTISIQLTRSAIESESRNHVVQELKDKVALLDVQMAQIEALIANIIGVEEITDVVTSKSSSSDRYTRLATQARIGYVLNNFLNLRGLVSIDIFTLSDNEHYYVGETLSSGTVDEGLRDLLIRETRARKEGVYWAGVRPNINGNSKHRSVLVATRLIQRFDRISGRQEPVALLVINYDPSYVNRQFDRGEAGFSRFMYLLDGANRFAQHPDASNIGTQATPAFLDNLNGTMAGPDSNMLAYIAALHAADWRLVALIPEEIIARPARNIVRASAGVMLVSLLIVSIGATFFLRRILLPLREIIDRFRLLRTAPDAKQTDMIVIGNDEIAHLGDGFNDLLGALRARQQSEEELRVLNRELEVRVEARTRDLEITNADLSLARDAAEVASRAKSAFLANMSHELRTPMNAIMGFTDLARKRSADPKQQDQLTHVTRASQHLLDVINDILDISRIEANRVKLTQHVFTPGVIVEDALNLTAQEAANKGLRLSTSLSPGLARTSLLGDPTRLRQILVNLINNAIKFTKNGAINVRIGVAAETPTELLLRCEIQDTGIGISAEDLKRLFTAFEQADNSMTRRYGGAGLGLAISKRLVHMMRGEIGVESQLGLGSTFWFTVRLGRVASETPLPAGANDSAAYEIKFRHARARILLAEDDPANQEVTIELLTDLDLKVDLAENGVQAVDMAAQIHYDLILMDIRMPELNGVDAARAIRTSALNAKTPILALTANAYDEDREACTAAGMNDHIAKPVSPDRLFEILLKWLP